MDRLSTLLAHFSLHANTYFSGVFCGAERFTASEGRGHVHLLRAGRVSFRDEGGRPLSIDEPSLLLVPRPYGHELHADAADGAELVCASLSFDGGMDNPLSRALPGYSLVPLRQLPSLAANLDWLFAEAFGAECGRDAILNRLFELMLIQLLRHLMAERSLSAGMLAGLAEPRLSRALTLMHDEPARPWTVEELAHASHLSRASFAALFRKVIGVTPADYLLSWRVSLAQKRLREGRPVALVADETGYESPSALARAFRRKVGASPREWLQALRG
ncbi:AraC family transcriptional regulator [Pseudomonas citronellolis]|uniref:AraC family transcriptional regulator n=1 Tax=Pseudomonas citronellolis TaxID=53408 RepID=UPI0023E419BB|nr:AraC family transcriptional regulator [Pseudomonas citronellolis]MDF3931424.1 AraC family transcriptional regulator [Pseudomonas citronellolis]